MCHWTKNTIDNMWDQAGCKAVVLLDNTPSTAWRVSSPLSSSSSTALAASSRGDTPVLMIREADWRRADTQVTILKLKFRISTNCLFQLVELSREGKDIFLTWNDPSTLSLAPLFSCTPSPILRSPGAPSNQQCSGGKTLHRNGSLQEEASALLKKFFLVKTILGFLGQN